MHDKFKPRKRELQIKLLGLVGNGVLGWRDEMTHLQATRNIALLEILPEELQAPIGEAWYDANEQSLGSALQHNAERVSGWRLCWVGVDGHASTYCAIDAVIRDPTKPKLPPNEPTHIIRVTMVGGDVHIQTPADSLHSFRVREFLLEHLPHEPVEGVTHNAP